MTRRSDLATIHVAKKHLGLDDGAYRALLGRVAGVESAAALDARGRRLVLAELGRLGFNKGPGRAAGRTSLAASPQARKIRALWINLGKAGGIEDRSERALEAWVKRQTGVDSLRWITIAQGNQLIEALKDWLDRAETTSPSPSTEGRDGGDPVAALILRRGIPFDDRPALIQALWDELAERGAFRHGRDARLDTWLFNRGVGGARLGATQFLTPTQQEQAIDRLSCWLWRISEET